MTIRPNSQPTPVTKDTVLVAPKSAENAAPAAQQPAAATPVKDAFKRGAMSASSLSSVGMPPAPAPATPPAATGPKGNPPGQGQVLTAPGAGNPTDKAALKQAGGTSYVGTSQQNDGREVTVYASPHFDPSKPYKVMVYGQGFEGSTANTVGGREHMAEAIDKLNEQGANILLVMPQGPGDPRKQQQERTERLGWMNGPGHDVDKMTNDAIADFSKASGMPLGQPSERILMVHSAGGNFAANAYSGPNPPHFDKVMLADSAYGMPPSFKNSTAGKLMAAIDRLPPGQKPQVAAVMQDPSTVQHAREELAPRGIRVDPLAKDAPHYKDGHFGVPSYMALAFLGNKPKPFSNA